MSAGLDPIGGELDPPELAPTADLHLRLDNTGVARDVRGLDGLLHRGRHGSTRHRNPVPHEQLLSLILQQIH